MSFGATAGLGAIAGFTIFLGLPVGRLTALSTRTRAALAMFAVGILAFVGVDVLGHGIEILEEAVIALEDGSGSLGHALVLAALLAGGFTAGTAGIALIERRVRRDARPVPPLAGGATAGAFAPAEQRHPAERLAAPGRRQALETGMVIAAAIGLHNLAEGLAIGVASAAGEVSLATVLIVGFALHNATEGFGIVGPLGPVVPSWRWLAVAGLVAGSPTFVGSMVGYNVSSEPLELAFYALAGGAIFYVIGEVWSAARRHGHRELGLLLLSIGFIAGVLTDMVVAYGGG